MQRAVTEDGFESVNEAIRATTATEVFISPFNDDDVGDHRMLQYGTPEESDRLLQLAIVGDVAVGKTAYLQRLTERIFDDTDHSTTATDLRVLQRSVCDLANGGAPLRMRFHFWDTNGSERVQPLFAPYYRDRDGFLVAFDVSDRCSFLHVPFWIREVRRHSAHAMNVPIVVVGMKKDLLWRSDSATSIAVRATASISHDGEEATEDNGCPENFGPLRRVHRYRQVHREEAIAMGQRYTVPYVECSAKGGEHIDDVFATLVTQVLRHRHSSDNDVVSCSRPAPEARRSERCTVL